MLVVCTIDCVLMKESNKPKRALIGVNLSTFQRLSMTYGFLYPLIYLKVAQRLNQYSSKIVRYISLMKTDWFTI